VSLLLAARLSATCKNELRILSNVTTSLDDAFSKNWIIFFYVTGFFATLDSSCAAPGME